MALVGSGAGDGVLSHANSVLTSVGLGAEISVVTRGGVERMSAKTSLTNIVGADVAVVATARTIRHRLVAAVAVVANVLSAFVEIVAFVADSAASQKDHTVRSYSQSAFLA